MCWIRSRDRGGIHTAREESVKHEEDEDWGFLLVDTRNAFNEGNKTAILWTVRHLWPSGARFVFNYYRHWAMWVIQGEAREIVIEGGT